MHAPSAGEVVAWVILMALSTALLLKTCKITINNRNTQPLATLFTLMFEISTMIIISCISVGINISTAKVVFISLPLAIVILCFLMVIEIRRAVRDRRKAQASYEYRRQRQRAEEIWRTAENQYQAILEGLRRQGSSNEELRAYLEFLAATIRRPSNTSVMPHDVANAMQLFGITEYPYDTKKVKSVYRSMIKKVHPDQGGDHDTASNIISAYRVLMDHATLQHQ